MNEDLKDIIRNSSYSETSYRKGKKQGQAEAFVYVVLALVLAITMFVFVNWPISATS